MREIKCGNLFEWYFLYSDVPRLEVTWRLLGGYPEKSTVQLQDTRSGSVYCTPRLGDPFA